MVTRWVYQRLGPRDDSREQSTAIEIDPMFAAIRRRVTFLSDNRQDLGAIRTPTLILQCSDDMLAPYAVGEYVHHHMPASQLVVMKATGHCPNLSAPDETISAIKAFLDTLP